MAALLRARCTAFASPSIRPQLGCPPPRGSPQTTEAHRRVDAVAERPKAARPHVQVSTTVSPSDRATLSLTGINPASDLTLRGDTPGILFHYEG